MNKQLNKKLSIDNQFKLAVIVIISYLISPAIAFADVVNDIDKATTQWLNIERQTNKLQTDWETQEPLLKQRLMLLNAEKKQLKKLLSLNNKSGSDVDVKRKELLTEQTQIEQQQKSMTSALHALLYTNSNIASLLPPLLLENWQQEQVLTTQSNSELLQSALAQLTLLSDFDKRVSVLEGTIDTSSGQTMLVKQLFLGASTAWFISPDEQYVGWGHVNENGWQWYFDESIDANQIKKAIDIFHKKQSADWVTLPIHLVKQSVLPSLVNTPSVVKEGAH